MLAVNLFLDQVMPMPSNFDVKLSFGLCSSKQKSRLRSVARLATISYMTPEADEGEN